MYPLIDLSTWEIEEVLNASGSKEKRWYRKPQDNNLALFKLPISLTSSSSIGESADDLTGEMWSEKISSEIGKVIGIDTHLVDIGYIEANDESLAYYGARSEAIYDGKIYGAVCYSFLTEGEDILIEGADMIMEFDPTYARKKLQGESEVYSYQLLSRLFEKHDMTNNLYDMIVFDTLIGNTDRHQDNFGIILNQKNGYITFSPLYDNSSSLGREISNKSATLMMKDSQMFNAYVHGKKSASLIRWGTIHKFEKRINTLDLFLKIYTLDPVIKTHLTKITLLTDKILYDIIFRIPHEVMSDQKKAFVFKLISYRRDYLIKEFL
ncbi:HipA domain-containing protein [Paenibacillus sp. MMS18-CY102]|uniref:HipA domain-containing protein n=1 Tax=Paenibacillus sp. MMS18-CY102 TaxID=2682849 RepID=UPI001366217E|nr:HipA domain-containing protein [Paenibacillus sp. MMS18-CY102]MWC26945.1 phosphatidylinositol kinase [Paenibacillus sp. MMS18-CY102]